MAEINTTKPVSGESKTTCGAKRAHSENQTRLRERHPWSRRQASFQRRSTQERWTQNRLTETLRPQRFWLRALGAASSQYRRGAAAQELGGTRFGERDLYVCGQYFLHVVTKADDSCTLSDRCEQARRSPSNAACASKRWMRRASFQAPATISVTDQVSGREAAPEVLTTMVGKD